MIPGMVQAGAIPLVIIIIIINLVEIRHNIFIISSCRPQQQRKNVDFSSTKITATPYNGLGQISRASKNIHLDGHFIRFKREKRFGSSYKLLTISNSSRKKDRMWHVMHRTLENVNIKITHTRNGNDNGNGNDARWCTLSVSFLSPSPFDPPDRSFFDAPFPWPCNRVLLILMIDSEAPINS